MSQKYEAPSSSRYATQRYIKTRPACLIGIVEMPQAVCELSPIPEPQVDMQTAALAKASIRRSKWQTVRQTSADKAISDSKF